MKIDTTNAEAIRTLEIPDLWHLAQKLGSGTPEGQAVLAVWHLAHDLKKALADAMVD